MTEPPSDPSFDAPLAAPEPAPAGSTPGGRGRWWVIISVAALVAAGLGGAAFAAYTILNGGGPQPADVLPESTVAIASVDLDPNAGQKIEAIQALRKFPALRDQLDLGTRDDLRRYLFENLMPSSCSNLDYDDDIESWIGNRAAVAAIDVGEDFPAPAIVLAVTDRDDAEDGLREIADCIGGGDVAFAIGEDYAIVSNSEEHARGILADGESAPLGEDADYQRWTEEAGGRGVASFYLAPAFGTTLLDLIDEFAVGGIPSDLADGFEDGFDDGFGEGFEDGFTGEFASLARGASVARVESDGPDPFADLESAFGGFTGAAGAVRFADGGLDLTVAFGSDSAVESEQPIGEQVVALPDDTALAVAVGFDSAAIADNLDLLRDQLGPFADDIIDTIERESGLRVPGDIQALLGSGAVLSVGGDAPEELADLDDPEKVPAGLALHGDPEAARAALGRVERRLGVTLDEIPIHTEQGDGVLRLSPSQSYLAELVDGGALGDSDLFKHAVPHADQAGWILYAALDDPWRSGLATMIEEAEGTDASEVAENLAPFAALGISSSTRDGVVRTEVRFITD